ncbi:hypothetical protein RHSIM_RhsimUnG0161600 [Rhododendron simsii]|uniref:Uncharacterized protein n=1 Tax=Rhododendron simsii TaxID=118357 RepID=A0A834FVF9_RHOSS|nr:hypothetical protein RHSIM_RhsimUnG0161600 [Rhododendron simsii]
MATAVGFVSGGAYGFSWIRSKNQAVRVSDMVCRVSCVSSSTTTRDPYKTLMVKPGASKSEVKKAFRWLALRGASEYWAQKGEGLVESGPLTVKEGKLTFEYHFRLSTVKTSEK